MSTLLVMALGLVFVLNVHATQVLRRSTLYDGRQKRMQLGVIWCFPPVGAVLVIYLAREHKPTKHSTNYADDAGSDDGDLRLDNYSSGECDAGDGGGGGGGD